MQSSFTQGLHQVAQKLIIKGLPSLKSLSVFTFEPFMSVTVTLGSLKSALAVGVSWASKVVPHTISNVTRRRDFILDWYCLVIEVAGLEHYFCL